MQVTMLVSSPSYGDGYTMGVLKSILRFLFNIEAEGSQAFGN